MLVLKHAIIRLAMEARLTEPCQDCLLVVDTMSIPAEAGSPECRFRGVEKAPSWTAMNKGKKSKRQRRQ